MVRSCAICLASLLMVMGWSADAKEKQGATPASATNPSDAAALQANEKMQRALDAQNKRWDAEMHGLMKSICRGC